MRVGSRHVTFPIFSDRRASATESKSPIVVYRNLWHDNQTIADKLKNLGANDAELHGDLQVMLSTLLRMRASVELLLAVEEGENAPTS